MFMAPLIQPLNPSPEVQLPALTPEMQKGTDLKPKALRTERLHFMPLLSQYCTFLPIGAVSQILRASLVLLAQLSQRANTNPQNLLAAGEEEKIFRGVISITQFFSSKPQGRSGLLAFANYAKYP